MVKINDTVTFPNTLPAKDDHLIGTDVSDTGNSADGEVVTFKMSDLREVVGFNSGWHPYDMTDYGGSEDGEIYSGGSSAEVIFTNVSAGYDYLLVFEDLKQTSGSAKNLQFRVTDSNSDVWALTIHGSVPDSSLRSGSVLIRAPQLSHKFHHLRYHSDNTSSTGFVTSAAGSIVLKTAAAQTIDDLRIRYNGANIVRRLPELRSRRISPWGRVKPDHGPP